MNVQAYLNQISEIKRVIVADRQKLEALKTLVFDKYGDFIGNEQSITEFMEYEEKVNNTVDQLLKHWIEIDNTIDSITDYNQYEILVRYYILGEDFKEIALGTNRSEKSISTIHKKALQSVDRILEARNAEI